MTLYSKWKYYVLNNLIAKWVSLYQSHIKTIWKATVEKLPAHRNAKYLLMLVIGRRLRIIYLNFFYQVSSMQYAVRIWWNLWFSYLSTLCTSRVTEIQANFDINKRVFFPNKCFELPLNQQQATATQLNWLCVIKISSIIYNNQYYFDALVFYLNTAHVSFQFLVPSHIFSFFSPVCGKCSVSQTPQFSVSVEVWITTPINRLIFVTHLWTMVCKAPRIPQPACGRPPNLKKEYPIIASFYYWTWLDEELPPQLAKATSGRAIADTFADTAVSFRV